MKFRLTQLSLRPELLYLLSLLGLTALVLALLPSINSFIDQVGTILHYPYAWALTENENMLFIHGITSGQNFYNVATTDTAYYFVYPPLFHLLSAVLVKLFGMNILIPRLISVVSLFGLVGIIFFFFKERLRLAENVLLTIILAGFTVSITLYSKYYMLARADMFAYALGFGSLLFMQQIVYLNRVKRSNYFLAFGLALAALFTKQSVFFPYLVIVFLTGIIKDRKTRKVWIRAITYLALATIGVFLLLQLGTHGGFWQSMTLAREVYGKYLNAHGYLLMRQAEFITHFRPLLLSLPLILIGSLWPFLKGKILVPFSLILAPALYLNYYATGGNQGAEYNTMIPLVLGITITMKELYSLGDPDWGRANSEITNGEIIDSNNTGSRREMPRLITVMLFSILAIMEIQVFNSNKIKAPYLRPSPVDPTNQAALVKDLQTKTTGQWILGDRIDYAILLAGKNSPLEASTHNVARDWPKTQAYTQTIEASLLERLKTKQIGSAVVTITYFGSGPLLSYIQSHSTPIDALTINYMDAPGLAHRIYQINP